MILTVAMVAMGALIVLSVVVTVLHVRRVKAMSAAEYDQYRSDVEDRRRVRLIVRIVAIAAAPVVLVLWALGAKAWVGLSSPCGDLLTEEEVAALVGKPVGDSDLEETKYSCDAVFYSPGPSYARTTYVRISATRDIGGVSDFQGALDYSRTSADVRARESVAGIGVEAWLLSYGSSATFLLRHPHGSVRVTTYGPDVTRPMHEQLARLVASRLSVLDGMMTDD